MNEVDLSEIDAAEAEANANMANAIAANAEDAVAVTDGAASDPTLAAVEAEVRAEVEAVDAGPLADTPEKQQLYRVLRHRAALIAEADRIRTGALAMVEQIESRLRSIDSFYQPELADLTRKMLAGGRSKSLKTPFGVVGFRKQKQALIVQDESEILAAVLDGSLPEEFARTETRTVVAKAALNKQFEETGEIPPGCVVRPESDQFYVKHEGVRE